MLKIIAVLVAGIPALISGLLAMMGRKWLVFTATAALMVTLTLAFVAAAMRTYVMGDRGADHTEAPTDDELARLAALVGEGLAAGAIGFGIPGDLALCLSTMCSVRIARAAYELAMEKARAFNTAQ